MSRPKNVIQFTPRRATATPKRRKQAEVYDLARYRELRALNGVWTARTFARVKKGGAR